MIKEFWTLAKMLFQSKPSEIEEVKLMGMDHFPFKGYAYMMWCGKMIYRNDAYDRRRKEWITKAYKVSKNHETIHLMQAKMCGSWVKFYGRYFVEWLKGGILLNPASSAYYTIPYEVEAYANEENMDYPKSYDGQNLSRYTFTKRKKLYKKVGGTSKAWKAYVKTL